MTSEEDLAILKNKEEKATSTAGALSEDEKMKMARGAGEWLFKEELVDKKDKKNTKTKKTYLSISLTVLDDEESANTARLIMQEWEKLGVKVDLDLVSVSQVQTSVIKPRNYEAILFSQLLGNDPDSYFFWHSSQAGEGGLNLSNYKNEEADKLLEDGRVASAKQERIDHYQKFQAMVNQEAAAIFLYSPFYTYPQGKKVKNFGVKTVSVPADRFADINSWYIKTGQRFEW
jgi:peptide/nickel transport system substrate-binding protein